MNKIGQRISRRLFSFHFYRHRYPLTRICYSTLVQPSPSSHLIAINTSSFDILHKRLMEISKKNIVNSCDIPTLQEAITAYSQLEHISIDSCRMLLDFMIYNHRPTVDIVKFITCIPDQVIRIGGNNSEDILVEYIIRSIAYSPISSNSNDITKLLQLKGISPRSKNAVLKTLLSRASNEGDLEAVVAVEKQLQHFDFSAVELFMHAYNKCKNVDGVQRWLQYGLRIIQDEVASGSTEIGHGGEKKGNKRKTRMYNYLIDVLCRNGKISQALEVIQAQKRTVNAFSFGSVLQSLPCQNYKHLTYSYVFQLMNNYGVSPESESFNTVLWNIARRGRLEEFYKWLMRMHGVNAAKSGSSSSNHLYTNSFEMDTKTWNAMLACWCTYFKVTPSSDRLITWLHHPPSFQQRIEGFQRDLLILRNLRKSVSISDTNASVDGSKSSAFLVDVVCNRLSTDFRSKSKVLQELYETIIPTPNAKTRNLLMFLSVDRPDFVYHLLDDVKANVHVRHWQDRFSLTPTTDNISTMALVDSVTLNMGIFMNLQHRNPENALKLMNRYSSELHVRPDKYSYALLLKYAKKTGRNDLLETTLRTLTELRRKDGLDNSLVVDGNVIDSQLQKLRYVKWISPNVKEMVDYLRSSKLMSAKKFHGKRWTGGMDDIKKE